jgi:molybdopterin molybdotransferase
MFERILTYEAALAEVLHHAATLPLPAATETLPLLEAAGRTLATPVLADRDQPPFDRSTRDGYAVHAGVLNAPLRLIGSIRAGEVWHGKPLQAQETIEIMTGAPLPAGANAVLMVEHATLEERTIQANAGRTLRAGENVVPRGAEASAGQAVLPRGRRVSAAEIAVAASCGASTLAVYEKPKVAILATGDELVALDAPMETHQIRNSNSYALAALVAATGGNAGRLPIVRDTREDLIERIAQGSMDDLLLLTGGVSMGKYDLVEKVLAEFGAEFFFTGALIQPGKPIVFGRIPKRGMYETDKHGKTFVPPAPDWPGPWIYFFGLPGNPVSTQVCFHLFVAPLLRALCGRNGELAPQFVEARLGEDVKGGAAVSRFLPAELSSDFAGATVRLAGWQGSGDLAANARGNCYAVLPADVPSFSAGNTVQVLLR